MSRDSFEIVHSTRYEILIIFNLYLEGHAFKITFSANGYRAGSLQNTQRPIVEAGTWPMNLDFSTVSPCLDH